MQFIKTNPMTAGKRAPNTIDLPEELDGAKGAFEFIDGNTLKLTLENGEVAILFVSKGYSYSEVKPVEDTLASALGTPVTQIDGQGTIHGVLDDDATDPADEAETETADETEPAPVAPLDAPLLPESKPSVQWVNEVTPGCVARGLFCTPQEPLR